MKWMENVEFTGAGVGVGDGVGLGVGVGVGFGVGVGVGFAVGVGVGSGVGSIVGSGVDSICSMVLLSGVMGSLGSSVPPAAQIIRITISQNHHFLYMGFLPFVTCFASILFTCAPSSFLQIKSIIVPQFLKGNNMTAKSAACYVSGQII